jgi:MFS family permease
MSEPREHNSALAPFRVPAFRGLWTANVLSNIGGYINDVGAAWLMTSLSSSPLMVSLIQVAANAPFFLLALPAGALGDILDKRKLLLVTQVAMMVLSASLGILTLLGLISPVSLLLILFMVECSMLCRGQRGRLSEIVGPKTRSAITLNSVAINMARHGPRRLGGALVMSRGLRDRVSVNSASFVAVIAFWGLAASRGESQLPAGARPRA